MDQLDLYYRAFLEYRAKTEQHKESARQRSIVSHSNPDLDVLESVRTFCEINEDWVSEIEKGLVFVEKAIKEERQFIRNDGEVVPIEKAKHVDKHSVEHLARHSEFISELPEDGETLIPDKLYMEERDSDFAIYENRFLYMLLKYLESFIEIRYSRIQELGHTYRASLSMKKTVSLGKRHISFETKLEEDRRNDSFTELNKEAQEMLLRVEAAQHRVNALLATPLMEQVAKTPMVRPPITKTNMLRMNNNFKRAVELYEFVSSYEGDGYVIEERKRRLCPFGDTMADEFSEIVLLASFLTYEYGNDIKDTLKRSYEEEELRRRENEQQLLAERIRALKKRIAESGETPETYMLLLEKRIKALENDSEQLSLKRDEIKQLNGEIEKLETEKAQTNERIAGLCEELSGRDAQITALNLKYETDMAQLKAEHEQKISELCKAHEDELESIKKSNADEINALNDTHANELSGVRQELTQRLNDAIRKANDEKAAIQSEYSNALESERRAHESDVETYREQAEALTRENTIVKAQLNGIRSEHGLITSSDDFSSKERFEELEREYAAFSALFDSEWKKARKKIRKDILWTIDKSGKEK